MKLKKKITVKVITSLFFCLFVATYLSMKAMQSTPLSIKNRIHSFVRKAVDNEWPRTGIKAIVWEGCIATSLTALALEWATDFQTPLYIAYLAGLSNQAVEFLLYVPYDRTWNRKGCLPRLRDDNESDTIIHLDQATGSASSSDASGDPSPEDMV